MYYCVYKHTSPSGKSYIGLTCQGMERRARKGEGYKECSAFYNAIQKYGWDNFSHDVLEDHLSFEEACEKERRYIAEYQSLTSQNGYNLENGGRVNATVSEETRKKIAQTLTGRKRQPLSDETRKRISKAHVGKKHLPKSAETCRKLSDAHKGKVFSEEHRRHISDSKKGVYAGANNPRARKVRCIETGAVFPTIKDAGLFIGGSPKNIISVCRGNLKTSGGYHWEYADSEVEQ